MKNTKKITLAGLGAACALTLSLGVGFLANDGAAKADDANGAPNAATYFYDNLIDSNKNEYTLAKKFYNVLDKMNNDGDFLDGVVDYRLTDDVATSSQIEGWMNGTNLEVPKAFSAARDAFLTDHPELFYINFYKLTISVAKSGGEYVGYINSGKEANLFYDNGYNTETTVQSAITAFNARIDEIVELVNEAADKNAYGERDFYLAKQVNTYLAENIDYDYAAYEGKDDPNYVASAYINTPYGGLVNGQAVCGGFSTAYKVIMDKLGIPCITVNGYSNNRDEYGSNSGSSVYHMWNYVWLENPTTKATKSKARASASNSATSRSATSGAWYSVDVTWDSSSYVRTRYAVMNAYTDAEYHINDGVISSSGYELIYPELSAFNYGSTGETDGLKSYITYNSTDDEADDGTELQEHYATVSYNGKSAKKLLEEDGLYIVTRFSFYDPKTASAVWGKWIALVPFMEFAEAGLDSYSLMFRDTGIETSFYGNTSIYYTQFAVFDIAPDEPNPVNAPSLGIIKDFYFTYYDETVEKSNPVEVGEMLVNESYGTYTPPPYILAATPSQQSIVLISDSMAAVNSKFMAESKAFTMEITYDQPLHKLNDDEPIGISIVSQHPNAKDYVKFYPINSDGDLVELVEGTINFTTGEKALNTLRFKFAPSLMYEHDSEGYHIFFSNVGSAVEIPVFGNGVNNEPTDIITSDKQPMAPFYCCARPAGICAKRFNYDGRLYIECCAQPTLISNSDLSDMEFVDENGESTFSDDSRRQLMLVAERADDAVVNNMLDGISDSDDININKEDIKASETYEIALSLCAKFAQIKDGSYIKIALGFPEGYGPEDEGVTFKLYHRKHIQGDEYIIEEIPCVVTQFGIVATVTSFSPYMVAVVNADKATDKTVFASIEGNGGKLTKEDGKIISLKEGDSHTYTIQPDEGYQIYSVTLNGVSVADKVVDGKLTLGYADLKANNELVIQYIANEAVARIQQKIDNNVIDENVIVNATNYVINVPSGGASVIEPEPDSNNTTAIIIICVCSAVVVALGVAVAIVLIRKKRLTK